MTRKTGFVFIIIGVVLLSLFFVDAYQASVISEDDNTYELGGGVVKCGYYYSGYTDYSGFADFCETQGFTCFLDSWEGSFGTMRSIECQQYCYECSNGETTTWIYAPTCEDGGFEPLDESDAQALSQGDNPDLSSYCETTTTVTCYQCDGSNIVDDTFEGSCPNGWTTDWASLECEVDPPPEPEMVTCHKCKVSPTTPTTPTTYVGEPYYTQEFEGACDTGWTEEIPTCPEWIDCYTCQEGSVDSDTFLESCPAGWSSTEPSSCVEPVTCYQCQGDVLNTREFETGTCPADWSEDQIECSQFRTFFSLFGDLFSFDETSVPAVISLISIGFIGFGVYSVIRGSKEANKTGVLKL